MFCLTVCCQNWQLVNWINLAEARDSEVAVVEPGVNLDLYNGVLSTRTVHHRVSFFHL